MASATNRDEPGGRASARGRQTCGHTEPTSAQDPAWLRGPLTRDSQHCTCELAMHERAEAREATKLRATSATAASWAAPLAMHTNPRGWAGGGGQLATLLHLARLLKCDDRSLSPSSR